MSSNSLNRASTDGRHFDLDIFEKIIHHLISQELKTVKLISSPWIDILRATNDPEIAGPILRRIEDDCVMYEHVMSQSVNQIESVIHRVSSRMLRHAENAKDSVRNHRDRLGLGQRISPPAEPVTTSNTTYIDLTGPSCRVCGGSIEGSRATVYDRCGCIAFLRDKEGFVTSLGMKSFAARIQLELMAYLTLVVSVIMYCRDQQDCKVADIFSVGTVYYPYEGTETELVRHAVNDAVIGMPVVLLTAVVLFNRSDV
ncbi:hypothetical protein F5B18DRAFT_655791 [Nemania serpens]|nr:hypothetical protein F5B18DRAFT_655791 [Nemania serpens]